MMADFGDLYDEFGNYLGSEPASDEEIDTGAGIAEELHGEGGAKEEDAVILRGVVGEAREVRDIVLHEDKRYYETAEETYGGKGVAHLLDCYARPTNVELLIMDEDAQALEQPIIAPIVSKQIEIESGDCLPIVSSEFLANICDMPELLRNVSVMGHLHHGKTTLVSMFVEQTHESASGSSNSAMRYTDVRKDEQERGISLKTTPMTFIMEDSRGKSFALATLDCPGHPNFSDEVSAAARMSDGVLLVVDAAEGVMMSTKEAIKIAAAEGQALCLVLTKIDRLIVELKLPPTDAYYKLRHTIQEVNGLVASAFGPGAVVLDPRAGNVAFASAKYGWSFTLDSFASKIYCDMNSSPHAMDPRQLAQRLWGDAWFDPSTRMFKKTKPADGSSDRSFVQWVMEPLYKIFSQVIGEDIKVTREVVEEDLGVILDDAAYDADVKPLLKEVFVNAFGDASGIVDMLVKHVPSAKEATKKRVELCYTGPQDTATVRRMKACDAQGPLVMYVAKMFPKSDCSGFDAFARIVSGTVKVGGSVRVLGESYTPDDEEDSVIGKISNIWKYQARYRVPLERASAGSWVLLEGVEETIFKTATIVDEFTEEDMHVFKPLRLGCKPVVKIATEPLNPGELPKMVEGLRKINRSYPALTTKVEESGEHTIFGTGELYLDSAMKDLRELYSDVEIKVADPVVSFCETVVETSSLKCFADTPNRKNRLTVIAEPLDKGLAEEIERGESVSLDWPKKKVAGFFQDKFGWDVMAARSVWTFGPDQCGPNVLLDDTLASEVDKSLVNAIRSSVVQGFQWGAREGPLCDEPMRSVKFKLTDAIVAQEPLARGGGQIIPTSRRVCYSAFLMASPRLMEPVYYVEIQSPADCISTVYTILAKRRGHVTADIPKPGCPIFIITAYLPVIESFGFETDVRVQTQGQAFCVSTFDHWAIVPGDPLDDAVILRPLEPSPMQALARDFVVKTRRRKGLSDSINVTKYFDEEMMEHMNG